MKHLLKLLFALIAICAVIAYTGCKKSNTGSKPNTGTGSYTFNGASVNTNDTLGPDVFSGGNDVTMTPANGKNIVFVYNIPSQSSGSFGLSNGVNSATLYILGTYGQINFASTGTVTDSLKKTGANSFSFSCKVSDQINHSNTYTLTGSGTY